MANGNEKNAYVTLRTLRSRDAHADHVILFTYLFIFHWFSHWKWL